MKVKTNVKAGMLNVPGDGQSPSYPTMTMGAVAQVKELESDESQEA